MTFIPNSHLGPFLSYFILFMSCKSLLFFLQDLRFYDYRSAIAKAVPQLRILDDERFLFDIIDGKEAIRSTTSTRQPSDQNLKEDILLVQESLKALSIIEEDDDGGENGIPCYCFLKGGGLCIF